MDSDADREQISETIRNIQKQAAEYTTERAPKSSKSWLPTLTFLNHRNTYIAIPILLFLLLLFLRPSFVTTEKVGGDGVRKQHLRLTKLLGWSLGLGTIAVLGLYGYNYNRKTK